MKLRLLLLSIFILFICFIYVIYQPLYRDWEIGIEFYHDILGWHLPYDKKDSNTYCKFCNKEIYNNQENWYFVDNN
jgi:hypothetical protein